MATIKRSTFFPHAKIKATTVAAAGSAKVSKTPATAAGPGLDSVTPAAKPGLFGSAAAAVAGANAARGLAELGGAEALRPAGVEALDPMGLLAPKGGHDVGDLAGLGKRPGASSGYSHPDAARFPQLPNNRDAGGKAGASADALRPSTNPRDWLGGIASDKDQSFSGDKTVEDLPNGDTRTTYDHGDGTSTIVTDSSIARGQDLSGGRVLLNESVRSIEQRNADGSGLTVYYRAGEHGVWQETHRSYRLPTEGLNRTLDPGADGGTPILPPNHQAKLGGIGSPNRVDPGPQGEETGSAPSLVVDQGGLVGDPSMARRRVDLSVFGRLGPLELPVHVLPPRPGSGGDDHHE